MERELEFQLHEVGSRLWKPPTRVEELLRLLDQTKSSLSKVEQAPSERIVYAFQSARAALVSKFWLEYTDPDVMVGVTACINEIMRIMYPRYPYIDVYMKVTFERIVDEFGRLDDVSSRSFSKRVAILQSLAEFRSFIVMLNLRCHDLILKMFQNFLNTIGPENSLHVFPYMEAIMTILIEENGDIPSDLVSCLLESVKLVDKHNSPVAHRLGEKVINNCGKRLKPRLRELSKSVSLRDYSPLVASLFHETEQIDMVASRDIMAKNKEQTEQTVSDELPQACPLETDEAEIRREDEDVAQGKLPEEIAADGDGDDADRAQDSIAKKEGDGGNQSEKEPILETNDENKPNSAATSTQSPEDATTSGSHKKALVSSGSKAHKNKGKQKDIGNVLSINKRAHGKKEIAPAPRIALDESLVGSRIEVWWPQDRQFYPGTVGNYDSCSKKHRILYDDGDVEILSMKKERWEFLSRDDKMAAGQAQDESNRDSSPEGLQRKRAKASSSSGSKGSAGSAPQKRRGRPPKALSLDGGSSSDSDAVWELIYPKRKYAAAESKKEYPPRISKLVLKAGRDRANRL